MGIEPTTFGLNQRSTIKLFGHENREFNLYNSLKVLYYNTNPITAPVSMFTNVAHISALNPIFATVGTLLGATA